MKFTTPKITMVEYRGSHLFAAQSFIDAHPELINHVFVVPDREYDNAYFSEYCKARIDSHLSDTTNADKRTEDMR